MLKTGERTRSNNNVESFEAFLQAWLVRQQQLLNELLSAQQNHSRYHEEDFKDLIKRVLAHYQEYYEHKSGAAHENVFVVFSPPWFTSFERTFLWIAGFKPGLAFPLVRKSVGGDLSEEQSRRLEQLRAETKVEERELGEVMARVQENVVAPPLLELARIAGSKRDGERTEVEAALEMLRSAMEVLLESADFLRMSTATRVMEILNPVQKVRFLASAAQLYFKIRTWGLQRDAERQT